MTRKLLIQPVLILIAGLLVILLAKNIGMIGISLATNQMPMSRFSPKPEGGLENGAAFWQEVTTVQNAPNDIAALQDLQPSNPDATGFAIKVLVSKSGIQRILGQNLADTGVDLQTLDPNKLTLAFHGQPVALEIHDRNNNNKIDVDEEVRFFAGPVGDRYNTINVYWLTVKTNGLRMTQRLAQPAGATARASAVEKGRWIQQKFYESLAPGPDTDHWFSRLIDTDPQTLDRQVSLTATLSNTLPLVAGVSLFKLQASAATRTTDSNQCTLRVQTGNTVVNLAVDTSGSSENYPNWSGVFTTTEIVTALNIRLINTNIPQCTLFIDSIEWQRPVNLDLNGKGALLAGEAGTWTYTWTGSPVDYTLYDISDPHQPVILLANSSGFQDGPAARDYLVAGPGTIQSPLLQKDDPHEFAPANGADAIYIAPKAFHAALSPLITHRQAQGYRVMLVDVQDIYDAWNYGHVSPQAIRTMLRYTKANWRPSPISVVLVGDGTVDPHDYEQKKGLNLIPPYMAEGIDPWLGENACDNCYAQLDGDNPVTGDSLNGGYFFTDIWLGRWPVATVSEVITVTNKLLRYETNPDQYASWRNTSVFIADNYIQGTDGNGLPIYEAAGDFAQLADTAIALQPAYIQTQRIYYDPYPQFADPTNTQPWREPNAIRARYLTTTTLNAGAGLVTYNGLANHWVWALTDPQAPIPNLLSLYDPDRLTNQNSLFVALSLTSLASQFQKPAFSHTTINERLFLVPNGAVAVLGDVGLGVSHGYEFVERGFHQALWAAPPMTARLGEVVETGYRELIINALCCQNSAQTFVLFGDPLMRLRIGFKETPTPVNTATGTLTPVTTPTPTTTSTPSPTPTPPPGNNDEVNGSNDTCAAANFISANGNYQEHSFHKVADVDWIRFDVMQGVAYRIEAKSPSLSPADINLEVYATCDNLPSDRWVESFSPDVRLDIQAPHTGSIYLRLTNYDAAVAGSQVIYQLAVRPLDQEIPDRALIIVAGRLQSGDRLQSNIHRVTQAIYTIFQNNKYDSNQIQYLATAPSLPGYTAAATKENLRAAITAWAVQQLEPNGVLTLYLIDHGKPDLFFLDELNGQRITPTDLNEWLTQLENQVPGVKINIIIEACQAGSFITQPASISRANRLVITSTSADADAKASYAGAYFSDHFLTGLAQGSNVYTSFSEARRVVKQIFALQEAWIDGDGDSQPNELEDAAVAASRGFNYPGTFDDPWPPHIFSVQPPTSLVNASGEVHADVRDDVKVRLVWGVVYPPDYVPPPAGQELQAEVLPTFLLSDQGNNQFAGRYTGFTQAGVYRILIHAEDNEGLAARPVVIEVNARSRVYLPAIAR